ncbi:hypothetical protein SELMODRAFT_427847 [Selaginella moellendorffii]|uniref:Uncharacterized protein n=1 Tax=Selaginella moellendorffii TaxID=88036 RepID=D8T0W4_SELML|nr:hypothetical protein SELMODRAFT_427847 [Selaginella moellendorffii]
MDQRQDRDGVDCTSTPRPRREFSSTSTRHPVLRPDTPPPAVRPIPHQIIQIIMTRKQQQALNGNPSTPTPRTVLMDWDCPRQQVNQERQLPISAQAVHRVRMGKAPAEPRAKKAGGRGAGGSAAVHPASANSPTPLQSSAPPFEIPVVGATEVMDMEQEHHQEGREEEVPADPWGGFAQEPELEPAQVLLHPTDPTDPNAEEEMGRHQVLECVPLAPLPENRQQEAVPDVRPMEVERPSSRQDETRKRAHSPPHNGKGEHREHHVQGHSADLTDAGPRRGDRPEVGRKTLYDGGESVQFEGHLIGVQKFIEEHHKLLLTAITNLLECLPTTTDLPEDECKEVRQL